jgi:hypothetical protein
VLLLATVAGCVAPAPPPAVRVRGVGAAAPVTQPVTARATAGPERILLFGDSLLWQAAQPLAGDLRQHGMRAHVVNEAVVGSGLLSRTNDVEPRQHLRDALAAVRPSIVVFEYSGNHRDAPGVPRLGTEQFYDAWDQVARSMTALALAEGADVYWVVPPPRFPVAPETDELAARVRTSLPRLRGVQVVDWWTPFVDVRTGEYANYLKIDGRVVRVRDKSVIHFTRAGAVRAARWLVDAMRQEWTA